MNFKGFMKNLRQIMLCARTEERKPSLEIGSPTDVRRMDVCEGMPSLSESDKRHIREKASTDAIHLLSLQAHPTTAPSSPPPSPPRSPPGSGAPSPSHPLLLNAASTNLPAELPTPPLQKHADTGPTGGCRMKSMWERTRRLSAGLDAGTQRPASGYRELREEQRILGGGGATSESTSKQELGHNGEDEGVVMLDLDFEYDADKRGGIDSPVSICSGKSAGFEVQSTVGGTPRKDGFLKECMREGESSDSEVEARVERRPLVQA